MEYALYAILVVCLFWGARVCKWKEWNEDVLSYDQTKSFLGFCAIIIILHHCSQRTCAPWLSPRLIVPGLDIFVYVGYLCVAVFFFCSGFGMYTSSHKKKEFFKGYYKRLLKILIPAVIMWFAFFFVEKAKGVRVDPPVWINTYDYIWYIPAMVYMYLIFFLAYRIIKNETAAVVTIILGSCVYFVLCMFFSPGTWWYNTTHMFAVGVITAKHKDRIISVLKKGYPIWLILSLAITVSGFYISSYYYDFVTTFKLEWQESAYSIAEITGQVLSALFFVIFVILVGMKVKIGNKVLLFLGVSTLEIYLVHPLFVQLFSFAFIRPSAAPLYHIENPFLYAAAVVAVSVPLAYALHRGIKAVLK